MYAVYGCLGKGTGSLLMMLPKACSMQASSDLAFCSIFTDASLFKIRLLKCKDTDGPYGREFSRQIVCQAGCTCLN